MNFLKRNLIFCIVFITGGAVLIIEVTAFRILAPYFGNTLYSTSSIIGVVLGALSLGYYFGGILADRYPKYSVFFSLIIIAGIFALLIQGLSNILLVKLGYTLSFKIGPPIISLILFFFPSLILGMMSPFAIKLKSLREKNGKKIGRISGSVFFWSTLGSIAGSFAAGFFLIPSFGINIIIISTGLALIIIGTLGLLFSKPGQYKNFLKGHKLFLFLVFLIFVLSFSFLSLPKSEQVIFQKEGLYSKITIEDRKIANKKVRVLKTDNYSIQGGIFLDSDELPFEYTKYYVLYKILNPQSEKALFLGGGAYSIPKKLLSESNNIKRIDVVEIEPELYSLAKKYFGLRENERLFNYVADGRRFLHDTKETYDFIFTDVYYSISSVPVHFTTKEFFQLSKNKLLKDGFFMMNIIGMLDGEANQLILSEMKTFGLIFPSSYFFAVDSPDKKGAQNFIFLGLKDDNQKIDFSSQEILANENKVIRQLPEKLIRLENLDFNSAYLLTDNFNPIEYLTAKMVSRFR
ncbi:MAG TPA: hypothetical protein ENI19_03885 [Candidatus Nealsonbacteria bacterium]|uniref:PABS domain-containing protein n=1 Tax=marine sediment metagenome TaxID=412755 RepID=A0A0F9WZ77_9ZZZZ|nr:hypothetical protein [Candidatus Nealsonbacteria bacterium]HEB46810.1 hypothetical protein [Candidatus Nealsonbacteria bacterium]